MERATEGFSSRRSLLVSALTNYRYPPRLISAPTTPPWQRTAQLDARACAARLWGKAGNERRKACFHPGGSGFLLPRGGQGHSQFYSIDFHVTHRFFVSFLTQERNVTPSSPRSCPLSCSSGSAPRSGAKGCAFPAGRCSSAKSPARRQPPFASSPARRPGRSEAA